MKYFDASLSSYIRSGKNIFYYGILCDESKCSHIYAASYNLITGKNIAIKLNKEPHEPEGLGYFPSPVIVGDSVAFPKVLGTDKEVKFLKF